jgi:uncharacterized protein (TIGR02996 family)
MKKDIEALYTQILTDPHATDTSAYLVLADALLEQNDPLGELIQVQHALLSKPDDAALRERERSLLAGALGEELAAVEDLKLDWRLGFIEAATLPRDLDYDIRCEAVAALFAAPAARLLRSLTIGYPTGGELDNPTRRVLDRIRQAGLRPPATLRRLQIGNAFETADRYWFYRDYGVVAVTDVLSDLWQLLPGLSELRIDLGVASVVLGKIASESLRSFEWVSPFLDPMDLYDQVCEARWPNLERLVLWTGGLAVVSEEDQIYIPNYGGAEDDDDDPEGFYPDADGYLEGSITSPVRLQRLFDHLDGLEKLTTFGLCNYAGALGEVAGQLPARAFWKRIETLDLTRDRIRAADTEPLVAALREAPRLKRLVLDETRIADEALEALLELDGLDLVGEPGAPNEQYRYVVTME